MVTRKASLRRLRQTAVVLLLVLVNHPAYGQSDDSKPQGSPPTQARDTNSGPTGGQRRDFPRVLLRDVWHDQRAAWTSPFRLDRRSLLRIALPLAAGSAVLIATDKDAASWLPNTPGQVRWSKRVSQIGAVYTLGGILGGTMLFGKMTDHPGAVTTGSRASEALIDSVIVSHGLKYMTARERPLENDGKGRFWKGGNSFPSGHAMHTWAVAMAVTRDSGMPRWLKVTSLGVATAVSVSRWGAQKHFPSDVFVGAVLGGLIGSYVGTRAP